MLRKNQLMRPDIIEFPMTLGYSVRGGSDLFEEKRRLLNNGISCEETL